MDGRSYNAGLSDARYKYTEKERDTETGYDYFGARYYDARVGRWLSVDPLAEKYASYSPFVYCVNSPFKYNDRNGLEPNKAEVGSYASIVSFVRNLEAKHPYLSGGQILELADNTFRRTNGGSARYIYTRESGWIDFRHFFAAGNEAFKTQSSAALGSAVTRAKGFALEVSQYVKGNPSGFSYEDLTSNHLGADFGAEVFNPDLLDAGSQPVLLSSQLESYLQSLSPTSPTEAPNYESMPENDQAARDGKSRPEHSNTTSTQQQNTDWWHQAILLYGF